MIMKRVALSTAIIACVHFFSVHLLLAQHNTTAESPSTIYVAPNGDGTGNGSEAAPLATIAAARKRIRDLKASDKLPKGGRGREIAWRSLPMDQAH